MKYLTLVLVLFIAACSNDTKMPTEIDHKTDFSAHVVSENGLKTHGCVFQGNAVVGFELVCDEKKTHLELYQQRVAIIQYERDGLNWILNPNVIETPSGQLMNKTSLDAVFEKHKSVHNLIHVPKGIEGNSWLAKQFTWLNLPGTFSLDERSTQYVLQQLLNIAVTFDYVFYVNDDYSAHIINRGDVKRAAKVRDNFAGVVSEIQKGCHLSDECPKTYLLVENISAVLAEL